MAVDGAETAQRRDLDAQALFSLALAASPDAERRTHHFAGFDLMDHGTALQTLADGRATKGCALRPAVERRLARLAVTDDALAPAIDAVHRALADEAGGPPQTEGFLASAPLRLVSDDAAAPAVAPGPPPAAASSPTSSGQPVPTVGAPLCEDEQPIRWNGHDGFLVAAAWWSAMTVDQLRPWLNPVNWPACSHRTFFRSMIEVPGTHHVRPNGGWQIVMDETVQLDVEITTRLRFTHYEASVVPGTPPDVIWTEYELADPDDAGELVIDHGRLQVESVVTDDGSRLSWVLITKNFGYRSDRYQGWPTLACDTHFGELAMMMASNCQSLKP